METMLMNIHTGSVAPQSEWEEDFYAIPEDQLEETWGANFFWIDALVEVVANAIGLPGYNENYGDWRPAEC